MAILSQSVRNHVVVGGNGSFMQVLRLPFYLLNLPTVCHPCRPFLSAQTGALLKTHDRF